MFAQVNDLNIFYEERGDPQTGPILFLHGFPFDHSMWTHQMEAFSRAHRCIAPDLRGHGQTTRLSASGASARPVVTIEQMADDVIGLLDHLGLDQVTVCGLSMGGYIAFALWRKYAQRISRLILADTKAGADSDEARQNRFRLAELVKAKGASAAADAMLPRLFAPGNLSGPAARHIRQIIERTPPDQIADTLHALAARPDSTGLLDTITVPCLVVVGEHDGITPLSEAELMCRRAPLAGQPVVIPHAGHLSPLENPPAFNQAVATFLAHGGVRSEG